MRKKKQKQDYQDGVHMSRKAFLVILLIALIIMFAAIMGFDPFSDFKAIPGT